MHLHNISDLKFFLDALEILGKYTQSIEENISLAFITLPNSWYSSYVLGAIQKNILNKKLST